LACTASGSKAIGLPFGSIVADVTKHIANVNTRSLYGV
jgi:hypothetical protein